MMARKHSKVKKMRIQFVHDHIVRSLQRQGLEPNPDLNVHLIDAQPLQLPQQPLQLSQQLPQREQRQQQPLSPPPVRE